MKKSTPFIFFFLALGLIMPWRVCAQGASETRTILVFPFENQSGRPDLDWISEGFAEVLSSRLAGPDRFALRREERDAAYEQLGVPPESPLTLATQFKVAETLGVDWAIIGNFTVEDKRLTAHAQLLDVHRLKLASPLEATGELTDLIDVQTNLAWRLLATHDPRFTVGKEEDFVRRFPPVRLDAFENYVRGILATDQDLHVKFLTEADRLNPAIHAAAYALGRYYFEHKDYANSAKWLEKVDSNDAEYPESIFFEGVDDFFLGRETSAERNFETLEKQVPLDEVANNVGVLKARRGRYEEALDDFQRAYQADETDPDYGVNVGICLWYLKRYDEAAKMLHQAVALDADDAGAHALLALVDAKLGDTAGAQRERTWLNEHEGDASTGEDIVPQTRLKKHYDGRAFGLLSLAVRNALEARLASEPVAEHARTHLEEGQKLLAQRRLAEAERELAESIALVPTSSEAHLSLGQIYELEGRHQDAVTELETSLNIKNSATAHVWLARADLALGRTDAARSESEAALSLDPHNLYAEQLIEQIRGRASTSGEKP